MVHSVNYFDYRNQDVKYMSELNEKLLRAWLKMSTSVVNNRVMTELSFNEALICNILFREQLVNQNLRVTATELCNKTKMLKSQMNRTLNQLEVRGIIHRERSTEDKRQIFVTMNPEHAGLYHQLHKRILNLVDGIIGQIGEDKATMAADLLSEIANAADDMLAEKQPN